MLKIDNTLLQEVGLAALPEAEKNSFLKHIYETLEMRVGIRLADQMSNQQLDEFEQYFEAKDDAGAFKWLETNFPNYKDIVQEEFDKLKAEVAQTAPQILTASQAQAANPSLQQSNPAAPDNTQATPPAPQATPADYTQPAAAPQAAPPPAQPYAAPPEPQQPAYQPPPQPHSEPPVPQPPQQPQYPPQQPPAGPQQT